MDLGIKGKLAVVTGASSGIGAEVSRGFAEEGANVVMFARSKERLDDLAREIRQSYGVEAIVVGGDMRRKEDVSRMSDAAKEMGGADILVLNTGRPPQPMREILDETDESRWEDAYRTQLQSAIHVMQSLTPQIIAKKWGRIVGITSVSVKQPLERHALSTIFRAGLTAGLRHLANEVASHGVTVNCVCPGSIATESFKGTHNVDIRAETLPLKRVGRVDELAAAVLFFASHRAGFITGASLQVDGGNVAALQ